jgi:D-alanyl-D-alanine carboxypeptidase
MKKILIIIFVFILYIFTNVKVNSNTFYSESGILMNIDNLEVIASKNENKKHLTASIAKIMTCIVAIEEKPLDIVVEITKEDLEQEGSKIYLKENEKVYLKDLLYGLMLRSGNDAANAIARTISGSHFDFSKLMNKLAHKIGMKNSEFNNPSGLDRNTKNYSTAYDMALLMSYCYNNPIFMEINNTVSYRFKSLDNNTYSYFNKHRLIQKKSYYNGGKTGFTEKSSRTLVTTYQREGINLVVVTFKGSNDFLEHEKLFEYGFNKLNNQLYLGKQLFIYLDEYETKYLFLKEDIYCNNKKSNNYSYKIIKEENDNKYFLYIYKNYDNYKKINLEELDIYDNEVFYFYIKKIFRIENIVIF